MALYGQLCRPFSLQRALEEQYVELAEHPELDWA